MQIINYEELKMHTTPVWNVIDLDDNDNYCNLPKLDERVLVTNGEDIWIDALEFDEGEFYWKSRFLMDVLTAAWMELPTPCSL